MKTVGGLSNGEVRNRLIGMGIDRGAIDDCVGRGLTPDCILFFIRMKNAVALKVSEEKLKELYMIAQQHGYIYDFPKKDFCYSLLIRDLGILKEIAAHAEETQINRIASGPQCLHSNYQYEEYAIAKEKIRLLVDLRIDRRLTFANDASLIREIYGLNDGIPKTVESFVKGLLKNDPTPEDIQKYNIEKDRSMLLLKDEDPLEYAKVALTLSDHLYRYVSDEVDKVDVHNDPFWDKTKRDTVRGYATQILMALSVYD